MSAPTPLPTTAAIEYAERVVELRPTLRFVNDRAPDEAWLEVASDAYVPYFVIIVGRRIDRLACSAPAYSYAAQQGLLSTPLKLGGLVAARADEVRHLSASQSLSLTDSISAFRMLPTGLHHRTLNCSGFDLFSL